MSAFATQTLSVAALQRHALSCDADSRLALSPWMVASDLALVKGEAAADLKKMKAAVFVEPVLDDRPVPEIVHSNERNGPAGDIAMGTLSCHARGAPG